MTNSIELPGQLRRRRTDREPNRGWRWVALGMVVVALLDWGTKFLVASTIPVEEMVEVGDRVALWHVRNHALILGLAGDLGLPARKLMAVVLGLAAVGLLVSVIMRSHRLLPSRRPWAWAFAGLLGGGMMGNLGERALHWWVTDFLSFRWGDLWLPPGNLADLAIVLSLPLSIAVIAFELEARSLRRRPILDLRPRALGSDGEP